MKERYLESYTQVVIPEEESHIQRLFNICQKCEEKRFGDVRCFTD